MVKGKGFFSDYDLNGIFDLTGAYVNVEPKIQEKLNEKFKIDMIQHEGQDQPTFGLKTKLGIGTPATVYLPPVSGKVRSGETLAVSVKDKMTALYAYFNLMQGKFKELYTKKSGKSGGKK